MIVCWTEASVQQQSIEYRLLGPCTQAESPLKGTYDFEDWSFLNEPWLHRVLPNVLRARGTIVSTNVRKFDLTHAACNVLVLAEDDDFVMTEPYPSAGIRA